jgi:hypothetical protein
MPPIKPWDTSMPMFSNIGLDVSHGSMVGMNHLLLLFTNLRLTGTNYLPVMIWSSLNLMTTIKTSNSSMAQIWFSLIKCWAGWD